MIEYAISNSGHKLCISDSVLSHLNAHAQRDSSSCEGGGQLFACIQENQIIIKTATGPRQTDRRSRFGYWPDRLAERREIKQLYKQGLHYIGDWHTHAEPEPEPSYIDIETMKDIFCQSKHQLASFVLVIVGTRPLPHGLFVALVNNHGWYRL